MANQTRTLTLRIVGDERAAAASMRRFADDLDRAADRADNMGRALGRSGNGLSRLDRQIDESRQRLRRLGEEFERTGNEELFKDFNREQRTLAKLQRIHNAINDLPRRREIEVDVDTDRANTGLLVLQGVTSRMLGTFRALGGVFDSAMRLSSASAANMSTAIVNLSTNITNLLVVAGAVGAAIVAGMAAGGAAIGAATGAVYVLAAALASLPAVAVGGGAALGALGLGISGLSDRWKEMTTATKAAGGAAQDLTPKLRAVQAATREVAHAERDVAEAQRDALAAQRAISAARERAAERLRDLTRDLAGARLDEESAVLSVKEAERDLAEARKGGDQLEIARAELAYRQALHTVEDVRDRVGDLEEEHRKASKAGVEGSEEVQQALERQRQAQLRVADAQERQMVATQRLADAQRELAKGAGGGGGVAKEVTKLAPAAQKLLDVIMELKPAFERLRLGVQQRLFAGLAGPVRTLAKTWLPALETSLGSFADTFNRLAKLFIRNISTPKFISQMQTGMEAVRRLIERVGRAIAGPLVEAFGTLTEAAGPFLDALGDELAKVVEDFAKWIDSAAKSGQLQDFMEKASDFLRDVFDIGRDVVRIIGGLVEALFGDKASGSKVGWDAVVDAFDRLADWLQDPENQKKVREFADLLIGVSLGLYRASLTISDWIKKIDEWIGKVQDFAAGARVAFGTMVGAAGAARTGVVTSFSGALAFLASLPGRIASIAQRLFPSITTAANAARIVVTSQFNALVSMVSGLAGRISRAARGMWDGVSRAFRSAINQVIAGWNRLHFTIGGGSFLGVPIPSLTLNTPNLEFLDKGGFVERSGLAVIHKGETVVPAQTSPLSTQPVQVRIDITGSGSRAAEFLEDVRRGRIKLFANGQPVTTTRV